MILADILKAYKRLDNATANTLEEADTCKLLKARKAMRPFVKEFDDFEKDCYDKFKFDGIEEMDAKRLEAINKWKVDNTYQPSKEETEAIEKMNEYLFKVNKALNEELSKNVEVCFDKLGEKADVKLMRENKWKNKELDELEILF